MTLSTQNKQIEPSDVKECYSCKEIKSILEFNKNKSNRDGYSGACKSCISVYGRNYRMKLKDRISRLSSPISKKCGKCKEEKSIENFYRGVVSDGYSGYCKSCDSIVSKLSRSKSREIPEQKNCYSCGEVKEISEYNKNKSYGDGYSPSCRICANSANRLYRQRHPERIKNASQKQYQKPEVKDRLKEATHRRRALIRGNTVGEIPTNFRDILFDRQNGLCSLCDELMIEIETTDTREKIHIEHLHPISEGGAHSMDNLRLSHGICNLRKWKHLVNKIWELDE